MIEFRVLGRRYLKGVFLNIPMGRKESYEKSKKELLTDTTVIQTNRTLFEEFFEWEERKLKRTNNLTKIDDSCYKTLSSYIGRFKNVNKWFKNKDWTKLTKADIQKVYDDLEDGIIKNRSGEPYADRKSYYTKVFKAKPFKLAGKEAEVEEVMEFFKPVDELDVSFIEYSDFVKLPPLATTPEQKFLLWLAFDIGENIGSLLQLTKKDFRRQLNPETKEVEYLVNLRKEILKRSRRARVEMTNFKETVQFGDVILNNIKDDKELVFKFGQRQAGKFLQRCVKLSKVKTIPHGKEPTFKDLRSSMACYLLKNDWRIEEVNNRLGHSPGNLSMVGRYANYLALDKHKPKKKLFDNNLQKIQEDLEKLKGREKLSNERIRQLQNSGNLLLKKICEFVKILEEDPEASEAIIKSKYEKISALFS